MSKKILIMAGGTGGHIFPALAIARELKKHLIDIKWLGSKNGMENTLVAKYGYQLFSVSSVGLRNKNIIHLLKAVFLLMYAFIQTIKIFIKIKPDIVLGMGGFTSGIGGIIAFIMRIPLAIHEQNSVVGTTNKILAKIATQVFQAFDNTFAVAIKAKTVGNPVLFKPQKKISNKNQLNLLVLGGSLGAKPINDVVIKLNLDINIWHQSGTHHQKIVKSKYNAINKKNVKVDAFIDNIEIAYAWADIIICRAGAMTISEIMLSGSASILIPLPFAVDNHQYYNSKILVDNKAAILIEQKDLSPDKLHKILSNIDNQKINEMGKNAISLARPNSAKNIVKHLLKLLK